MTASRLVVSSLHHGRDDDRPGSSDTEGEVRFAYDATAARTEPIDDAYAMNVDDEGAVWLYFYSQFPIVRIVGGAYRSWALGIAGARALAVRGDRVLLFGDSHEHDFGRIVALEGDGACVVEEVTVEGDRGESLDRAVVYGRGGSLFFFTDRRALVLSDW